MKLVIEPEDRFRCGGCGKCCRNDWNIAVESQTARRLRETGPALRVLASTAGEAFVEGSGGGLSLARRQTDGGCVFLEGSLCALHAELGEKSKPLACQVFPYVLVPTPRGTVVGLSYFCPSVRRGEGKLLCEQRRELEGLVELARLPEAALSAPFRVWGDITTGWTGYEIWEEALLERLKSTDLRVLEGALVGLAESYRQWGGRVEIDELFKKELAELETDLVEALARQLFTTLGGDNVPPQGTDTEASGLVDPDEVTSRYLRSLIRRRTLLKSSTILEGLALLVLIPRTLKMFGANFEFGIESMEELLTHGAGVPGLSVPLVEFLVQR